MLRLRTIPAFFLCLALFSLTVLRGSAQQDANRPANQEPQGQAPQGQDHLKARHRRVRPHKVKRRRGRRSVAPSTSCAWT